tara:strand:+ start:465 stop:1586 length:1122 start_codon:yes stop_codon:yes gene_type:complete
MSEKLLIVTDFYKPHISGITTYIENFLKIYKNKNYEITILTGNYSGKLNKFENEGNIKIIRAKKLFSFNRGFYSFDLLVKFKQESKKNDKIIIFYPLTEIFPLIFLTSKPVILNYICLPNGKAILEKLFFFYFYFFGIISMIISKKIVVLTYDYFTNFLFHSIFKKKTFEILPYIPNFQLDTNYLNKINNKNQIKFGFLGRISPEKGIEYIIRTSNFMNSKNIKHQFIIAGDDKDTRFKNYILKLKKIAQYNRSIIFLGKINEKKKVLFLKNIDFLVLPSVNSFEAFGLVQLEAMSFGKLVLASNLKGVNYPVKLTKNGVILNNYDVKNTYNSIINIKKMSLKMNKAKIIKNYLEVFNKNKFKKDFNQVLDFS